MGCRRKHTAGAIGMVVGFSMQSLQSSRFGTPSVEPSVDEKSKTVFRLIVLR